jgi:hypothetical protein
MTTGGDPFAVDDVADQIAGRINSGCFDFANYKQEIQDLVTQNDPRQHA